jgi:hypothetical protein
MRMSQRSTATCRRRLRLDQDAGAARRPADGRNRCQHWALLSFSPAARPRPLPPPPFRAKPDRGGHDRTLDPMTVPF